MTPANSAAEDFALVPVSAPTVITTAEKRTATIASAIDSSISVNPR